MCTSYTKPTPFLISPEKFAVNLTELELESRLYYYYHIIRLALDATCLLIVSYYSLFLFYWIKSGAFGHWYGGNVIWTIQK